MSDDPIKRGSDRLFVALGQEHEVRHVITVLQKEFPDATTEVIRAAMAEADLVLDGSENRQAFMEEARKQLQRVA